MRASILAVGLALVAAPAAANCAPEKMVRIVTTNVTPGLPPGFASQPLVFYRQGDRYIRNEEAPDPEQKLHLLMVINEPDVWFVNRYDKTGQHIVDPGPTFTAHAPIFTGEGLPEAFSKLEFGCEAQFVRTAGLKTEGQRMLGGRAVTLHVMADGDHRIEIALDAQGVPAEAAYLRAGKDLLRIRYDAYEAGLPFDPNLFARPAGFAYTEQRPGTP